MPTRLTPPTKLLTDLVLDPSIHLALIAVVTWLVMEQVPCN